MIGAGAVLVLTGATATGKKDVGIEVARRLRAEIVGLDSIKVYRGFAIGAAQPVEGERAGVPMHLVGEIEPGESFSLGRWIELAAAAVAGIRARGALPLFVGGTPLYLNALLRGFLDGPAPDESIRARLAAEVETGGVEALHRRLAAIDPVAGARIRPRDFKRISRALEVFELTGMPMTEVQRARTRRPIDGDFRVVAIRCERELLLRRQEARVDAMLARGLVAEVSILLEQGRLVGEAGQAIGYREIVPYLRGECTLEAARAEILRNNRDLTRKQRKWFKRFPEIRWVERTEASTTESLADAALEAFAKDQ